MWVHLVTKGAFCMSIIIQCFCKIFILWQWFLKSSINEVDRDNDKINAVISV